MLKANKPNTALPEMFTFSTVHFDVGKRETEYVDVRSCLSFILSRS